eukprot:gene4779-5729_t
MRCAATLRMHTKTMRERRGGSHVGKLPHHRVCEPTQRRPCDDRACKTWRLTRVPLELYDASLTTASPTKLRTDVLRISA